MGKQTGTKMDGPMVNSQTRGVDLRPQSDQDDEIDLARVFGTIWRGKFIVLGVTLAMMVLGFYYAFFVAVPEYTARTSVALESRQEQIVDIESVVTGLGGDQATINTEIEVMRLALAMRTILASTTIERAAISVGPR